MLLSLHEQVLTIEVVDSGAAREHQAAAPTVYGEHGRGLDIVEALADEW